MNITIVGAGNVGTQIAVHAAEKGNKVLMYTDPNRINKELKIIDEKNNITNKGIISLATLDEEIAFSNSDVIFVTYPAFKMEEIANKIYPYANKNMKICLVPGTGGGEWEFKNVLKKEQLYLAYREFRVLQDLLKKEIQLKLLDIEKS